MKYTHEVKTIILNVFPLGKTKFVEYRSIDEMLALVKTVGGIVVEKIIQKRGRPSAKTFLGEGKIEEATVFARENNIDLVIVNGVLKPNQHLHLSKLFPKNIKIWDRIDLILEIFDRHASAPEAKAQIKLARLHHDIPKIYAREATTLFERSGAGIGTRGAGERGIEEEKRHIRRQIKFLEEKLAVTRKKMLSQQNNRKKTGMPVVALVGYTNAGKSSLMKVLTRKPGIKVDDALFVTLETKIGVLWLPSVKTSIFVADTIGFIHDLPPQLIQSFLTTLTEAREADILIHVVDISDPDYREKIETTEDILQRIDCKNQARILVFNKYDRILERKQIAEGNASFLPLREYSNQSPICLSAEQGEGMDQLKRRIESMLFPER